jgi:hypothetical protein
MWEAIALFREWISSTAGHSSEVPHEGVCSSARREASRGKDARAAFAAAEASFLKRASIAASRLQFPGREKPTSYAALTLDANQSSPKAASYVVKRKRGHR